MWILHACMIDKRGHIIKIGNPAKNDKARKKYYAFLKSIAK